MQIILMQQLREYFSSLRVQLGLLIVVAFFSINGLTSAWRMEQVDDQQQRGRAQVEDRLDVESLYEASNTWLRAEGQATGTEFIAEGGFKWMWGRLDFLLNWAHPSWFFVARDVNFWMTRFDDIDWLLVVRIVLSFLCIVLAYDGISGEVERGTLRQILANPLSRARLLTAKYLAGLLVVMVATLVGAVVSLLVLSLHGAIQFNLVLFTGIGLFVLGTMLYVSLFLFLALGVSALVRNSVASLVLLTLAWAVFVVVVPQTSYLIAMQAGIEPEGGDDPGRFWTDAAWELRRETVNALMRQGMNVRDSSLAVADGYAQEQRLSRQLVTLSKEVERLNDDGLLRQLARYRVSRAVNLLSPGYAYQYATEALMGAGIVKRQSFYRQARAYREEVAQIVRERDAADPNSPHLPQLMAFRSKAPLGEPGLPRFSERPPTWGERLEWGSVPLLVLVLEAVLACLFAVWAVNRTDVTGYAMSES
ncbi:MAG: ABC transporter permease subunit [Gemmatimonadetes bacterium]|jgi:ABC-type transport system involved in multi-copper enzyme maturation permease subunit|nr:ABC transporter permease subunit [Gemmatimonadota bacterium]MBT6149884.1 ABC transporter permease subunit [Gemmatimonadota bacterium]MBT7859403.1 ABC transporter permease subunit [Gemmatimonadota bacterium]